MFSLRLARFVVVVVAGFSVCHSVLAATFAPAAPPGPLTKLYRGQAFEFGYLTVPEVHAVLGSKQIRLAVVILRAQQATPGALPVFFLTGGPGGAATDIAPYFPLFTALQRQHDIVLIDQRGTGYSEPFLGATSGTYASIRDGFTNAGVDLTAYNTTENAADIADLREALGYSQIVLLANSYGTFLAQEVMRSFPTGIAAAVMNGVVPPTDTFIPTFNRSTLHGVNALFHDVASTPAARAAFPNLSRTYFQLLKRLRKLPLRMDDGFNVTLDDFQGSVQGLLQSPERIRLLPLLITEITEQRGSNFVKRLLDFSDGPRDFAIGMYLSVLGTDWNQPGWLELTRRTDAKLRPFVFRQAFAPYSLDIVRGVQFWNVPYRPLATRTPLQSNIPTLLLAGEMEAQTPPNGAKVVGAGLPAAFVLKFPRSGHITGFTPGPALNAVVQFVNNPFAKPRYSLASLNRKNFYATTIPPQLKARGPEELPLRFLY